MLITNETLKIIDIKSVILLGLAPWNGTTIESIWPPRALILKTIISFITERLFRVRTETFFSVFFQLHGSPPWINPFLVFIVATFPITNWRYDNLYTDSSTNLPIQKLQSRLNKKKKKRKLNLSAAKIFTLTKHNDPRNIYTNNRVIQWNIKKTTRSNSLAFFTTKN